MKKNVCPVRCELKMKCTMQRSWSVYPAESFPRHFLADPHRWTSHSLGCNQWLGNIEGTGYEIVMRLSSAYKMATFSWIVFYSICNWSIFSITPTSRLPAAYKSFSKRHVLHLLRSKKISAKSSRTWKTHFWQSLSLGLFKRRPSCENHQSDSCRWRRPSWASPWKHFQSSSW